MKNKVINFLFPLPSIIITAIMSVAIFCANFNSNIKNIPIIIFSIILFYIVVVIPLDFVIYLIKKFGGFIKNKKECPSNNNIYNEAPNVSIQKTEKAEDDIPNKDNDSTLSPEESIRKVQQLQKYFDREYYKEKINERKSFIEQIPDEELKKPAIKIQEMYKNFGIDILVSKIHVSMNHIFYIIVPLHGIRSNTLFSFKDDISVLLGTKVEMEALPNEGGIGIFIPVDILSTNKPDLDSMDNDVLSTDKITCTNCNREIPPESNFCPYCRYPIDHSKTSNQTKERNGYSQTNTNQKIDTNLDKCKQKQKNTLLQIIISALVSLFVVLRWLLFCLSHIDQINEIGTVQYLIVCSFGVIVFGGIIFLFCMIVIHLILNGNKNTHTQTKYYSHTMASSQSSRPNQHEVIDYDNMNGHQFEYFCSNILSKNGFENVNVTKGSGDQGIDIIAYKDGIKYGIQCKCYSSDVGNKAVQEAFSGKVFYNCHIAAVLTNRFFTKSAIELSKKNGVVLWDRNKLNDFIRNSRNKL